MGSLKSLAQGFLVATGLVWIFNIVALVRGGDAWLGLAYLLILLIPAVSLLSLKFKHLSNTVTPSGVAKWRTVLFAFQGVALAFWSYDLLTTVYAIDITGLAIELNPLGWPLGILGAFAFYGPSLLFSYVLLFRLKENISFYAAIPLTMVSMCMSLMNLFAGAQNFQVFVHTATLAANVRFELIALAAALNLVVPFVLTRRMLQPKPQLSIKTT
ncbi:MAG: hypothetical protein NWE96_10975 [Candidatus Bathyarchaeota archaeon]|nr:hypothetical protein [Candidatus Bathyarchaeota archaeon]